VDDAGGGIGDEYDQRRPKSSATRHDEGRSKQLEMAKAIPAKKAR
jgi:hypothetical protein